MTQQTAAAPSDVLTVDPLPCLPVWKIGATYWCRNMNSQVVIVSTSLRGEKPIAGILLASREGDEDEVYRWANNGVFNTDEPGGVLDLTQERV